MEQVDQVIRMPIGVLVKVARIKPTAGKVFGEIWPALKTQIQSTANYGCNHVPIQLENPVVALNLERREVGIGFAKFFVKVYKLRLVKLFSKLTHDRVQSYITVSARSALIECDNL